MRMIATDFVSRYRPTVCDLRVFLREREEKEHEPGPFDEVLRRLGMLHEQKHLQQLGPFEDLRKASLDERVKDTLAAIARKAAVLYQPAFLVKYTLSNTDVEIVGMPDFLILDGNAYVIRDSKISRRIDEKNHPEILLQIQLYGWLFEKTCGAPPSRLQIHSGTGEIVEVPYDGGASALANLETILAIRMRKEEFYEPVGWSKCLACGFNERCWERAEANSDVAVVRGVDQNLARTLHGAGIRSRKELLGKFDVNQLSEFKRPYGKGERKVGTLAESILQCAESMERGQEKILAHPAIPEFSDYVMFDLEGMPPHMDELDRIYLWGMKVFGANPGKYTAAVSGFGPNGDREGWTAFLENAALLFERYGDIPFLHWAAYEHTQVVRYIDRYGDVDGMAARVVKNLKDLFRIAEESLVLPIPSFSLKVVEKYIKFKRSQKEFGGQWAMAKFIEATETDDENARQEIMAEILLYNEEDLAATWAVFEWMKTKAP